MPTWSDDYHHRDISWFFYTTSHVWKNWDIPEKEIQFQSILKDGHEKKIVLYSWLVNIGPKQNPLAWLVPMARWLEWSLGFWWLVGYVVGQTNDENDNQPSRGKNEGGAWPQPLVNYQVAMDMAMFVRWTMVNHRKTLMGLGFNRKFLVSWFR